MSGFFLKSGFASDRRAGKVPVNFEQQLILHANSGLWSIDDVNVLVRSEFQISEITPQ